MSNVGIEFVRLVDSSKGSPRLAQTDLRSILRDPSAGAIERAFRVVDSAEKPFARVFVGYLVPHAFSSRLWTARRPVAPSQIYERSYAFAGHLELMQLSINLLRAHRLLRRTARRPVVRHLCRDAHRAIVGATSPGVAGLLRRGDMTFRSGSFSYLMPAASTIEPALKRFASDWRHVRVENPVIGPLVAALCLSFLHPFADGNGRLMRAFSATAANGETDALCNTIACFLQGRQRLWNFTLPLALGGSSRTLWDYFEASLTHARVLREAVETLAVRYRDRLELRLADLRGPFDATLVGSAVLDDRTFRFLVMRASSRIAKVSSDNYFPRVGAEGATHWINSGANAIVDGLTGPLLRHT